MFGPIKEIIITVLVVFLIGTPIVNIIDKPIENEIIKEELIEEIEKDLLELTGNTLEELENMSEEELLVVVNNLKERNSEFKEFYEKIFNEEIFEDLNFEGIKGLMLEQMNNTLNQIPNSEGVEVYKTGILDFFNISFSFFEGASIEEVTYSFINRMFEYILVDCFKQPQLYSSFPKFGG